jgi:tetratricopeptide (TPR) repeat protein
MGLAAPIAVEVSRHLVMAGRLIDDEPELAWAHAAAARGMAGRLAIVREAAGLTAYRSGRYAEALAELRTARRLSGSNEHLPVMADCERGLGRPERALTMVTSPEAASLDRAGQVELRIVAAGARLDLGQAEAAVVTLQTADLESRTAAAWLARLRAAYAGALAAAGRAEEAQVWWHRAADVDETGETGAAVQLGIVAPQDESDDEVIDLDEFESGDDPRDG